MRKLRGLTTLLVPLAAMALVAGLAASSASAAPARSAVVAGTTKPAYSMGLSFVECTPTLYGTAFPYTATTGFPPDALGGRTCGNSFAWGYTVSGDATGYAEWDGGLPPRGGSCTAEAWIPDSHSDDPNAQYYIWDGTRYLGNDAFVNQDKVSNNWVNITNNTRFQITDHLRITLSDHNPAGEAWWYEAAYAVLFSCEYP